MEQGEEEVYDEAADGADGAEQGDGAEEDAGFDEDELDSALADAQGGGAGDESSRIRRLHSGGSQGAAANESDARSIYVGNVDYTTESSELEKLFSSCGAVTRVTIPLNHNKCAKGFAYVEFATEEAAQKALSLNESSFKDRLLKVIKKRTNVPSFNRGRGRGGVFKPRGRGGFRGGFRGRGGSFRGAPRGRGRGH